MTCEILLYKEHITSEILLKKMEGYEERKKRRQVPKKRMDFESQIL
uniref:Uncharacterized protein n=1 Tax=Arundo donax TaxID=35708 RepID=A0A0A9AFQ3_ARUDO